MRLHQPDSYHLVLLRRTKLSKPCLWANNSN